MALDLNHDLVTLEEKLAHAVNEIVRPFPHAKIKIHRARAIDTANDLISILISIPHEDLS